MADTLALDLPEAEHDPDNITDWALVQFRQRYGDQVTKDDIWEYMYGVMHAPDWRERYKHDLQRNLPRIPLADNFEAFRVAGRRLMDLHIGYETVPEYPVQCMVDDQPDDGGSDADAYRIKSNMQWGGEYRGRDNEDRSVLKINDRCKLVGIPDEAHHYEVSGRSPLHWAVDSLKIKRDTKSGIVDDVNGWHDWANEPYNLIRHLRRLIYVSVESARIVDSLPPSLPVS